MATSTNRSRLSRVDWIDAGVELVADGGVAALAVEPLARRLDTTKGSFYWHFTDRAELLAAVLGAWTDRRTDAIIRAAESEVDPVARLRRLLVEVTAGGSDIRFELNLVAAMSDPVVASAVGRVTERRVAFVAQCYRDAGLDDNAARHWSLFAYSAHMGLLYGQQATGRRLLRRADRLDYIVFLTERLLDPLQAGTDRAGAQRSVRN